MKTRLAISMVAALALVFVSSTAFAGRRHGDHGRNRGGERECNYYGCFERGGGCNYYGCWERGGGCSYYGCWERGGGCSYYGCWERGGACNMYGCSDRGTCSMYGCP